MIPGQTQDNIYAKASAVPSVPVENAIDLAQVSTAMHQISMSYGQKYHFSLA